MRKGIACKKILTGPAVHKLLHSVLISLSCCFTHIQNIERITFVRPVCVSNMAIISVYLFIYIFDSLYILSLFYEVISCSVAAQK